MPPSADAIPAPAATDFPLARVVRRPAARAAFIVGVWTLVALFNGSSVLLRRTILMPEPGPTTGLLRAVLPQLCEGLAWAFVTPLVLALYARFPLTRARERSVFLSHLLALAAIPFLVAAISFYFYNAVLLEPITMRDFTSREFGLTLGFRGHALVLSYLGFLGVLWGTDVLRRARERELAAAQLETRVADARLRALRMQLHPHFLFNTLNTLLPLIFRDRDLACRTVVRLGDLVRTSLKNEGQPLVPLEREIDFLRRYLEIEEIRFKDRLTVSFAIEPGASRALIPNLILQPLVENAVKHGLSATPGAGRVEITAARTGDRLRLTVSDDGPGLPPENERREAAGVGVANTRERLRQLYGASHVFTLQNSPGGGVAAVIDVPFTNAAAPNPASLA